MKKEDVKIGEVYRIRNWDDMKEEYGIDDGRLNMPFYKISKDVKQFCGESVRAVDYHDGLFKLIFLKINDNVPYLWLPRNILEPLKASPPFPEPEVKDYYPSTEISKNMYHDLEEFLKHLKECRENLDNTEFKDSYFIVSIEDYFKSLENKKIVISVYTREDYDNLLDLLDSLGYKWVSGSRMDVRDGVWEFTRGALCIELDPNHLFAVREKKRLVTHASKFYYEENNYEIIEYNEFCDKIIKGQLFETDKVKIKNIINQKQKPMLQKLTDALKKHLPGSIQKQYKANLRDGDLELTGKGRELLLEILADEYEDKLTEKAEEIIKEVEEE